MMRPVLAILVGASMGGCSQLSADQQEILQAITSDATGAICLQPVLRGRIGGMWARLSPRGFESLSGEGFDQPDIHLRSGEQIGAVLISNSEDCFEALVPRVDDKAVTALFLPASTIIYGLERRNGTWTKTASVEPDI